MPWTRQTIRNPSDKFQMLLYPWIENDFSSDYNASPLRSEKTASSQRSVLRLIDSEKAKNNTKYWATKVIVIFTFYLLKTATKKTIKQPPK